MELKRVGPYTLERTLGRGGMATVYLARADDGQEVALKLMHPHLAADPVLVERFLREIEATRALSHPNVVQLLAAGEVDGQLAMACELCDGGSVEWLLHQTGKLSAALVAELAAQLFEGLAYAHGQGLVHRDLKPANLVLTRGGVLKIADFGIARTVGETRLTRTGLMMGTPGYVSPEQAQGRLVDARSDLFAAGVVLFELLSGRNPHEAPDPTAMLLRVMRGGLPLGETEPTVAPAMEALVESLLERDPAQRPASAAEALERVLSLGPRQEKIVAEALADPEATHQRLSILQAAAFEHRAQELLAETPPRRAPAALWLHRARLLEPGNAQRARTLSELCEKERIAFSSVSGNPKVLELEQALEENPHDAKRLVQLAQLYRLEGNLARTASCLKRAVRLRPSDTYLSAQLGLLTGERPAVLPGSVTASMAVGIRTGGFEAQAADPPPIPAGPSAAAPVPIETASGAAIFWRAHGTTVGVVAVLATFLLGGVTLVGRLLHTSTSEVARSEDELRQALAHGGPLHTTPAATAPAATTPARPTPAAALPAAPAAADASPRAAEPAATLLPAASAPPLELAQPPPPGQLPAPPSRHLALDGEASLENQLAAHARDASMRLAAAFAAFRAGDAERAIAECDGLIDEYPKRPEAEQAAFLRGSALLGLRHYGLAHEAFAQFRRERPGSQRYAEALLRGAQAALELADAREAVALLDQLLGAFRDSPFALEAQLVRGEARASLGDLASARADLRAVAGRLGPADPLRQRARRALEALTQSEGAVKVQ